MMKKVAVTAIACALGLTACSGLREPTDAQLAILLHREGAAAADTKALLDSHAIDCMRSWSGNDTLLQKLPVGVVSVEGKKACHGKLDSLLADASRNSEKFTFNEITAPKVVTRASDLQEARRMAELANPANHVPPAALAPAQRTSAFATPDPNLDLGVAGAKLSEAEALCKQAQAAAGDPKANERLKRFAGYCVGALRRVRITMQTTARNGNKDSLDSIAVSAENIANVARKVLAEGSQK